MDNKNECVQGVKNQLRIETLEKNMDKLQRMIFWLTTSSFMLLAGLIGTLITIIVQK